MNDARTVTINGKLYYIENDAYNRLHLYLSQLKTVFGTTEEGAEIVRDIEGRVSELIDEIPAGTSDRVVNINDINSIITVVGRPEEIARECELPEGAVPPPFTGTADKGTVPPPLFSINIGGRRKLYRNLSDTVFGGVLSGIATYFNWNVTILRLLVIILTLCTSFFPVFLIYCILWMIIPPADTPARVLAMNGSDVNPQTLGEAVMTENNIISENRGSMKTFLSVVSKLAMGFIGVIAAICGLGAIITSLVLLVAMIASLISGVPVMLDAQELAVEGMRQLSWWGMGLGLSICLLCAVSCLALVWAGCCVLLKTRAASRAVKQAFIGIGGILLIAFIWTLSMTVHYDRITGDGFSEAFRTNIRIENHSQEAGHGIDMKIIRTNPDKDNDTITITNND